MKSARIPEKTTEYSNKLFDEKKTLNAQKLEVQYETEKKKTMRLSY